MNEFLPQKGIVYFLKKYFLSYAVISAIGVSFFLGSVYGKRGVIAPESSNTPLFRSSFSTISKDFDTALFSDVWRRVKRDYITKDTADKKLFYGALSGVVGALEDPYSVFLDPDTSKKFDESLSGEFDGIGAEIGVRKTQLVIISPLPGTPAEKAGLRAGDAILAIDKKSTAGMTVDHAVSNIRGKKGTPVTLTILRSSEQRDRDITILRDHIVVPTVTHKMHEANIGYVKISHFNQETERAFRKAIRELLGKNMRALILDLRNDPGGFLDTAIQIAGFWIDGEIVVVEKYSETKKEEYRARSRPVLKDMKTVILVNEGSASASEIVAGALQDYGKATVLGKKTFGKGSVQDLQRLSGGAALKLTIAEWLTPKGRSIQDQGINPDIEVELKPEDAENGQDPQLDRAVQVLKKSR